MSERESVCGVCAPAHHVCRIQCGTEWYHVSLQGKKGKPQSVRGGGAHPCLTDLGAAKEVAGRQEAEDEEEEVGKETRPRGRRGCSGLHPHRWVRSFFRGQSEWEPREQDGRGVRWVRRGPADERVARESQSS